MSIGYERYINKVIIIIIDCFPFLVPACACIMVFNFFSFFISNRQTRNKKFELCFYFLHTDCCLVFLRGIKSSIVSAALSSRRRFFAKFLAWVILFTERTLFSTLILEENFPFLFRNKPHSASGDTFEGANFFSFAAAIFVYNSRVKSRALSRVVRAWGRQTRIQSSIDIKTLSSLLKLF